jgi:hypothetical protein
VPTSDQGPLLLKSAFTFVGLLTRLWGRWWWLWSKMPQSQQMLISARQTHAETNAPAELLRSAWCRDLNRRRLLQLGWRQRPGHGYTHVLCGWLLSRASGEAYRRPSYHWKSCKSLTCLHRTSWKYLETPSALIHILPLRGYELNSHVSRVSVIHYDSTLRIRVL